MLTKQKNENEEIAAVVGIYNSLIISIPIWIIIGGVLWSLCVGN